MFVNAEHVGFSFLFFFFFSFRWREADLDLINVQSKNNFNGRSIFLSRRPMQLPNVCTNKRDIGQHFPG